jgi:tetratricopeptide (TPR) repeat protein
VGRQGEAERTIAQAIELDPLNAVARAVQARILFAGRRFSDSIEAGRRALLIKSENTLAKALIGWDLIFLGRLDEAARALDALPPDDYRRLVGEAALAVRTGHKDRAAATVQQIERRYGDAANYQIAEIYSQTGERDQAIAALEAAWSKRDSGLASMLFDPFLDPVRKDPRFSQISQRIFA